MTIYNLSLYVVFLTFFQFLHSEYKTLQSFVDLGSLNFFSKIFLFTLLANSNFFILFPFFFILIFIGLYFYIQNVRFLNSTSGANFTPITEVTCRNTPLYYYLTFTFLFFLTFGVYFTEDLLLLIQWLLF